MEIRTVINQIGVLLINCENLFTSTPFLIDIFNVDFSPDDSQRIAAAGEIPLPGPCTGQK